MTMFLEKKFNFCYFTFSIQDPCSSQPCQNQGTCVNNADGTYTCLCPPSILGINCENPGKFTSCDINLAIYISLKSLYEFQ